MTDHHQSTPYYAKRMYRLVTGVFGSCLAGLGLYAMFFAGPSTALQQFGGAVLVVCGGNMIYAAYRARESWLSTVGPLP